ncbi:MAG: hypothetical protein DBY09_03665 [Selenomonadales bacterium]|jgi:hypothetical protein|nr:hypothetical protein [Clostridiales bacterium]PWL99922.1 MAG: hypothetical protein DBY09_03665 [Selenomonadales bacterium]
MKKLIAFMLAGIMLLCLSSCGKETNNPSDALNVVSGGSEQESANLKDILVEKTEQGVRLVFSFVCGSEGVTAQEQAMKGLPPYTLSLTDTPYRLKLSIAALAHWDYVNNSIISDETGLIQGGVVKVLPSESRSGATDLYFNLSSMTNMTVSEEDGRLVVDLAKKDFQASQAYYVVGNLYYEYSEGSLPEEAELTPTLATDLTNVVMISRAFGEQSEAEALMNKIKTDFSEALAGKELRVIQLEAGKLPEYYAQEDLDAINLKKVIRRDGQEETAQALFPDGVFICWSPDKSTAVFSKRSEGTSYDEMALEYLFTVDSQGVKTQLLNDEYAQIVFGAYSPDGSKLLIIEQVDEIQYCSIYDFNTHTRTNLPEEEVGTYISGIAWASDSQSIYMMSAVDIMLNLKKYDIASGETSPVSEGAGIDTSLYAFDGKLYYIDVVDEAETLVSLELESGEQNEIAEVGMFSMSSDGRYILLQSNEADMSDGYTKLSLYDNQTGESKELIGERIISDYFFSVNNDKVYVVSDTEEDVFMHEIYCYDIASGSLSKLFDCVNGILDAGREGELLVRTTYSTSRGDFPVTYAVSEAVG